MSPSGTQPMPTPRPEQVSPLAHALHQQTPLSQLANMVAVRRNPECGMAHHAGAWTPRACAVGPSSPGEGIHMGTIPRFPLRLWGIPCRAWGRELPLSARCVRPGQSALCPSGPAACRAQRCPDLVSPHSHTPHRWPRPCLLELDLREGTGSDIPLCSEAEAPPATSGSRPQGSPGSRLRGSWPCGRHSRLRGRGGLSGWWWACRE